MLMGTGRSALLGRYSCAAHGSTHPPPISWALDLVKNRLEGNPPGVLGRFRFFPLGVMSDLIPSCERPGSWDRRMYLFGTFLGVGLEDLFLRMCLEFGDLIPSCERPGSDLVPSWI